MPPNEKLHVFRIFLPRYGRLIVIAILTILSLLSLAVSPAKAAINQTINFQSKIVNKASGLNLSPGSPACVIAGAANDTCDFRVRIWNHVTNSSETAGTGNLMFTQTFEDVEIGETSGIFNLNINSCGSSQSGNSEWGTNVGECAVVDDSDSDSDPGVDFDRGDLYIEISFATADTPSSLGTFSELFTRKPLTAVPAAFHAQNASALSGLGADGFVQLSPSSAQTTGDTSNPLVYLNEDGTGTPNLLQLQVGGTDQLILTNGGSLALGVVSPDAFLDIKAATTSSAQINLTSSGGTNPSAPVDGDLWYNGTNLYFYNGSSSTDLLAGLFTDGGALTYLTSVTDDFAIGGTGLASPFSVDVDTNTVRIGSGATTNASIALYASDGDTGQFLYTTDDLLSFTGGDFFIGSSSSTITTGFSPNGNDLFVAGDAGVEGNIYTDGDIYLQTDIDTTGAGDITISFGGTNAETLSWNATNDAFMISDDLLPTVDDTYDLGSSTNRWRDLYLGPGSLHIGTDGDEGIISFDESTNTFEFDADGDGIPEFSMSENGNLGLSGDLLPNTSPQIVSTTESVETVDSEAGNAYQDSDVVIGSDGLPVISYYDTLNDRLKIVHCGDDSCSTGNTVTTISNSTDDIGTYSSIAIGSDGLPIVAFRNNTTSDIGILFCGDLECDSGNNLVFHSTANSDGLYLDLTLDPEGNPMIPHFDTTEDSLYLLYCEDNSCSSRVNNLVYAGTNVGYDPTLIFGVDGLPFITYHNITDNSLDWSRCDDVSCTSSVHGTLGAASGGEYSKVLLGTDGVPLIFSLVGGLNTSIQSTHCGNAGCTAPTNTDLSTAGTFPTPAVALTTDGFPLLVYRDSANTDLMVAMCADRECSELLFERTVVVGGNTGIRPSMVVPADGRPLIVFSDNDADSLEVLKCANESCSLSEYYDYEGGTNLGSAENFFNNIYGVSLHAQDLAVNNFDVAEEYYVEDQTIKAGDVVRFKKDATNQLIVERTQESQDAEAIGVISTEPGLYLKDWQKNVEYGRPVALAGRVPVKVTNENGPIKRGDFLTPASTPGYAMKADEGGVIIGRAMEDFDPKKTTEEGDSPLVDAVLQAATDQAEEEVQKLLDGGEISEDQAQNFVEAFDGEVTKDLDIEEENEIIKEELQKGESADKQADPNKEPEEVKHKKGRIMMFVDLGYAPDEQFGINRDAVVRSFDINYFSLANGDNLFDVIDNPQNPKMILNINELVVGGSVVIEGNLDVHGQINAGGAKIGSLEVENRLIIESGENEVSGRVTLAAGASSIEVKNVLVTDKTSVHLTSDQFANYRVVNIKPGVGFTIETSGAIQSPTNFNYLIIN